MVGSGGELTSPLLMVRSQAGPMWVKAVCRLLFLYFLKDSLKDLPKKVATKVILPIFTPENNGADKTEKPGPTTWTDAPVENQQGAPTSAEKAYHCDSRWVDNDGNGTGSVTQADIDDEICVLMEYTTCFKSGASCLGPPLADAVRIDVRESPPKSTCAWCV